MGQQGNEPSMEDILASIKRIIAEDGEAPAAAAPPRAAPRRARNAAAQAAEPIVPATPVAHRFAPDVDVEDAAMPDAPTAEAAPPPPPSDPEPTAEEPSDVLELTSPLPDERDPILSGAAEQASRSAFAALGQLQVRADPAQATTLEGLVAELLKPMLRDWLDRELPALVERLVAAEIQRVSGRG